MIELICIAVGALLASLWWRGRMWRAVLAWRDISAEWEKQARDGTRLLGQATMRIAELSGQLRQLGYEPWPSPPPARQNDRKKEARR